MRKICIITALIVTQIAHAQRIELSHVVDGTFTPETVQRVNG